MIRIGLLLFALLLPTAGIAKDASGSKDHPLVGRYQGSEISFYNVRDFNKSEFLKAPLDGASVTGADRHGAEWLKLEGRETQIRYDGPAGRSSLEVMENLKANLSAKGFEIQFECADDDCFSGSTNDAYLLGWALDGAQENGRYAIHARYVLASLDRPEGKIYGAILVGEAASGLTEFVHVIELKAMDADKIVFVDADAMQKAIDTTGRVSLYGIFFDTDRDVLKPESKPTLAQIARLLKAKPAAKLIVVGHTDNQGAFEYNVDLSRRRAFAVISALAGEFHIEKDRLTAFGAGMASPAAVNTSEEGRAKNRRVELVER